MDINLFRADHGGRPAILQESQRRRGGDVKAIDDVIELDRKWREAQFRLDGLKAESRRIGKLISEKKKDYSDLVKQMAVHQPEIGALEAQVQRLLSQRDARLIVVGNVLHPSVPIGGANIAKTVIRSWKPELAPLGPEALDYSELLRRLGAYDVDRGVGGILRGVGIILQQALLSFATDFLLHNRFTLIASPLFIPKNLAHQLADDPAKLHVVSHGASKDMCIAAGDETLLSLHAGEWLDENGGSPRQYASFVTCMPELRPPYRGFYGQHQTETVKIMWLVDPQNSFEALEQLLKICESFYTQHRVVLVPSTAVGRTAAKEYEIECLLPGTQHHRPLARISNLTDYRSRQLAIRYGPKKQGDLEKKYASIISATLCSLPPLICALLEQHQAANSVNVPEVLKPRMHTSKLAFTVK